MMATVEVPASRSSEIARYAPPSSRARASASVGNLRKRLLMAPVTCLVPKLHLGDHKNSHRILLIGQPSALGVSVMCRAAAVFARQA